MFYLFLLAILLFALYHTLRTFVKRIKDYYITEKIFLFQCHKLAFLGTYIYGTLEALRE